MARNITEHECAKLREHTWNGRLRSWIADDFGLTSDALRYHIHGNCDHNHDVPPVGPVGPADRHDGHRVPTLTDFE